MQIYKVGGAVRDRLLGRAVTEIDWVVVGSTAEEMQAQGYRPVGADFPVFLHPRTGEEYALARTERKSGRGYGGFTFYASPEVTLEEDLVRRDLTINAIAEDPNGKLIDPYGGQRDIADRVLRHVSLAFAEDPLRVLRVARFAARYADMGFRVAAETEALMRQLAESGELQALTPERSWKEISRALMESRPDVFVQVLRDCGALEQLFPEIDTLFDAGTKPSVGTASRLLQVLRFCADQQQPLPVRWASLLHDLADNAPCGEQPMDARRIDTVSARFKVPRDCQELAALVGSFQLLAERAMQLSAAALFEMLQHFDIYRRPDRFEQCIEAWRMIAHDGAAGEQSLYPQADYLRGAAMAARDVQVKMLIDKGYKGAELGEAIKAERLRAIQGYVACQQE